MVEDKKEIESKPSTASGLPENTAAALCYAFGWVTGLIFFVLEKNNKTVKFHALQSMVVFGLLQAMMFVPFVGVLITPILGLVAFGVWILLILKTYQGEKIDLPYISEWVRSQVK